MERIRDFFTILDYSLDTNKKKHLVNEILTSVIINVGGKKYDDDERNNY